MSKLANLDLSDLEKMTFRAIQSNPALGSIPGKVHAKIEKKLLTSF